MATLRKYKRRSMRFTKGRKYKAYRKHSYSMKRRRNYRKRTKRRKSRKMRGGSWHQFQTNVPRSLGYSSGGILDANLSALANPSPIFAYKKCR